MRNTFTTPKPITSLFAAAAGLIVLTSVPNEAAAEPIITVEHLAAVEQLGGARLRRVDCGSLYRFPETPNKVYVTCDFAEQVDSEGKDLCSNTDNLDAMDTKSKKAALAQGLYIPLIHFARVHSECITQAGTIEKKFGKDPRKIYGDQWQEDNHCTLTDAIQQCKSAMGLD